MKKNLIVVALLLAALMIGQRADAELLGLEDQLGYPDIMFDHNGTLNWTPTYNQSVFTGGTLRVDAADQQLLLTPGGIPFTLTLSVNQVYWLYTDFTLEVVLDSNLDLVSGYMIEELQIVNRAIFPNGLEILDEDYYPGDVLLATQNILDWGWGEIPGDQGNLGSFDFLISSQDLYGELVDDGIWPGFGWTGISLNAERLYGWDGTWDEAFSLGKVKGDKSHLVPEPASLLLLGSGLIGLAAVGRKKKRIA
ncbi:MAG: VPLPA-CTERM sorting domain-containing protein [Candidatus Omnitrophica bacterium]|nr:VPLPA-CTERM sorting domain-containing protein [Candidatus Omnitrophota bacterium]